MRWQQWSDMRCWAAAMPMPLPTCSCRKPLTVSHPLSLGPIRHTNFYYPARMQHLCLACHCCQWRPTAAPLPPISPAAAAEVAAAARDTMLAQCQALLSLDDPGGQRDCDGAASGRSDQRCCPECVPVNNAAAGVTCAHGCVPHARMRATCATVQAPQLSSLLLSAGSLLPRCRVGLAWLTRLAAGPTCPACRLPPTRPLVRRAPSRGSSLPPTRLPAQSG